jgi:reactive intermediate/imine deaminase
MRQVAPADVPPPAGIYSPGIVQGGFLFCAGQGPFDAAGNRVGETFAEQVRITMRNLEAVAAAAGTSLSRTVRMGVFLRDTEDFAEMNSVVAEFLTEPYPARTTVQVPLKGFDVEIDAIIALED